MPAHPEATAPTDGGGPDRRWQDGPVPGRLLASLLRDLPEPDRDAAEAASARADRVLRPAGAMARLDELAVWLASWQGTPTPTVARPAVAVFVASHGVCEEGVSAYPSEVTAAMERALRDGVATAAVMARHIGATLEVVDVGVDRPTANLAIADAMDPERFDEAVTAGADAVDRLVDAGADLLAFGEMGIGNTTAAAAVAAAVVGGEPAAWVGRGTGVDEVGLGRKAAVVTRACERISGTDSGVEALRRVGGAELAATAGALVRARHRRIPVVLDGYVVSAPLAALAADAPGVTAHCVAGHVSAEPGHRRLLDHLGITPLLDLDLRLGEGSGALAAIPLVRLAAAVVTEVATFDEVGLG
jgi:nicotinate-nucleotide--dimethylbenzimidazole phosphoribosyltransferase